VGALARLLLGPPPPESFRDRPLPPALRGWRLQLTDPAKVLRRTLEWIERLSEEPLRAPPPEPPPPDGVADRERQQLIEQIVDAFAYIRADAVRQSLVRVLAEIGVDEVVVQEGEPFDPHRHKAWERVPTTNPALDELVAGTERPGFSDRGRVVRFPEVRVYRLEQGRGG
jgi:GrpE